MKTDRQLTSLMASIRVLSSTRELPDVLRQLLQEALHVIDGSTAGVLFLYDEQQDVLYAESAIGFNMETLGKVRLKPGEGMSGKTFQQKRGNIYSHLHDTKTGMANLSTQNAMYYEQSLPKLAYPVSALSVPLYLSDGTCIGVLTVDIFERKHTFEPNDLDLLETFARQASIAVENARLYSQNKRTQEIHQALSRVSLSYGGLNDITGALAHLLSKHVVVVNEFAEELSSYPEQSTFTLPSSLLENMLTSLYIEKHQGVQTWTMDHDQTALYTFPIQIDAEPIGLLIIIGSKEALLSPLDQVAIEQALPIFVMELHQREKQDVDDLMYTARLLEMVIHSSEPDSPTQELLMHIPTGSHQRYVIGKLQLEHSGVPVPMYNRMKQQLMRKVYYEQSKLSDVTIVYERHFDLTFLFTFSSATMPLTIRAFLNELLSYTQSKWNLSGYVGLGRHVSKPTALKESYMEAVRVIHYLQRKQRPNELVDFDSLGPYRLFLNMNEEELIDYVFDKLGILMTHDPSSELLNTLFVYMEQGQRLKETALALYVHVNTVKYRLKKIYELLGIKGFTVEEAFNIHLALKIANYLEISSFSHNRQK
ncbi:helix-turn-helix domain-containing protein [Shouchella lehensis]|uniref:GAF domain-containing protein n=1 Tax=Shouchella lehensis G1 TaxID=1246626 RepID=A0A060LPB7_9BACI|nr:helix-turn-helix domain-containing protein [Shouchella lehensis]AIC93151.1 hypothetical protein BleG1_0543 [Shouchella lehensis G1]